MNDTKTSAAPTAERSAARTGLATRPGDALSGTSRDTTVIDSRLRAAQEQAHLIAPSTRCDVLPPGCAVTLNALYIDPQTDTYPVPGGGHGLSKSALQRLSALAGVTWDPRASGRVDDGSDPHYCEWRAVGHYRSFDGQVHTILATKEMDMRDGSAQVQMLEERAKGKGRGAEGQIREMRGFIAAHAETKAQLRAIRSLGIKTAYTREELSKPFVAAKLMFTGQSDDPQLRRLFAEKTADAMMGGAAALYGGGSPALPAGAPVVAVTGAEPGPPPSAFDPHTGEVLEVPAEEDEPAPAAEPPRSGVTVRGQGGAVVEIEDADASSLTRAAQRLSEDLADGVFPPEESAAAADNLAAIQAELQRRVGAETPKAPQREMY